MTSDTVLVKFLQKEGSEKFLAIGSIKLPGNVFERLLVFEEQTDGTCVPRMHRYISQGDEPGQWNW